jgi:hypothetical protein
METNDEVNVPLKPNENGDDVKVVPAKVPFALARTAKVGLGSPGNTHTGCVPHDTVPRLPRVAEPDKFRTSTLIVKVVDVTKFVTVLQFGDAVHPVVTSGRDWKLFSKPVI